MSCTHCSLALLVPRTDAIVDGIVVFVVVGAVVIVVVAIVVIVVVVTAVRYTVNRLKFQ
jgi:hypothetical protein